MDAEMQRISIHRHANTCALLVQHHYRRLALAPPDYAGILSGIREGTYDDGRLGGQVVRTVQAAPGAELPLWLRSPWVGGDHLAHTFCVGVKLRWSEVAANLVVALVS